MEFFSFVYYPKNLVLSYKTDLDLWDCLANFHMTDILFVVVLDKGKPCLIAE